MFSFLRLLFLVSLAVDLSFQLTPCIVTKEILYDSALIGTWEGGDSTDVTKFIFKPSINKSYELTFQEKGETFLFKGYNVQLGKFKFLDLYPKLMDKDENSRFDLIPMHTIVLYKLDYGKLQLAFLDPKWVEKKFKKNFFRIGENTSYGYDGDTVITAPTAKLQKLLMNALQKNEKVFEPDSGYFIKEETQK